MTLEDSQASTTTLHQAIAHHDWEAVVELCFLNRDQAQKWVEHDDNISWNNSNNKKPCLLPIHAAMMHGAPLKVAAALLMAYPEAAQEVDCHGRLPLHYACQTKHTTFSSIALLLMVHNHGAKVMERSDNYLPIHQLCQFGAISEEILQLLLVANPDSIDAKDILGRTPLDILVERFQTDGEEFIKILKRCSIVIEMSLAKQTPHAGNKISSHSDVCKINAEIESLQVQVDSLEMNKAFLESKQVMNLQTAFEMLLRKQMETETKYYQVNCTAAKLQLQVDQLEQEKKQLECQLRQIVASEHGQQQKVLQLNDIIEKYSNCHDILRTTIKCLTSDLVYQQDQTTKMAEKNRLYVQHLDHVRKEAQVQVELMKHSAFERENILKDLIQMVKAKTKDELAEQMMLMKIVESKKNSWFVEVDRMQRRAKRMNGSKATGVVDDYNDEGKNFSKNALFIDTRHSLCGYDSDASENTTTF